MVTSTRGGSQRFNATPPWTLRCSQCPQATRWSTRRRRRDGLTKRDAGTRRRSVEVGAPQPLKKTPLFSRSALAPSPSCARPLWRRLAMRSLKRCLLVLFVAMLLWPVVRTQAVQETVAVEALAGFANESNGMVDQATFDADREAFEERDTIADGLGPVYNAQSCAECHQNPVTGSSSQVTVMRAGHRDGAGNFFEAPGGSLINDRAIHYSLQERVSVDEEVRAFRSSLSTLGDGYVEAIDDATLMAIAA